MYKYYNKDNYYVMEYNFDSITEFIDYIDNTPTNTKVWSYGSLNSRTGNYDFCKTHSLQEAKDLCKFGYHEDFDKLVELKLTLEKYIKMSYNKNKQYNYYVGYAPDVKAYLEGSPLSMFNRKNPLRKHIDIYYNSAIPWYNTSSEIFNRGAVTLCIVEILENLGFSVGLNVFVMLECGDKKLYVKFNLKRTDERLNVQKLFFPFCHPSFLRRLVLRLCEVTPNITYDWTHHYGYVCNDAKVRKVIDLKENDIVISIPRDMGISGNDIVDDANMMFDYINKYTGDDVELEQVKKLEKTNVRKY